MITWDTVEEKQFLRDLRQSSQSLRSMVAGKFTDKKYPLEYAYGLTIGAGLTRCKCGEWSKVEDLERDGVLLPCHHLRAVLDRQSEEEKHERP